ncbi:hypothetical protein B4P00_05930 [Shewanella xiamenensis]|nr:hypothetical protein [Shewanella xiamenensis]
MASGNNSSNCLKSLKQGASEIASACIKAALVNAICATFKPCSNSATLTLVVPVRGKPIKITFCFCSATSDSCLIAFGSIALGLVALGLVAFGASKLGLISFGLVESHCG